MDFTELRRLAEQIEAECGKAIIGKGEQIRLVLTSLFAGGHVLIDDIPGVGKTTLVKALSAVLGCGMVRVQFTPDLLPSDIVGMNIYSQKTGEMVFTPGPVMTNILLADEINRATPRTQSALLECMAEGQVTVDGVTRRLEPPFFVIATQNPVETLGTYPLPEAQLDRFLLRISMQAPSREEERAILERFQDAEPLEDLAPVCTCQDIRQLQAQARKVYVHPALLDYLVELARASRDQRGVELGVSPRGTLALLRATQAYAMLAGRAYAVPEDVKAVAVPVLAHRLSVSGMAGSSAAQRQAAGDLLQRVEVPTEDWGR